MPRRSPPKRATATTPAPRHIPQAIPSPVSAASLSKMKGTSTSRFSSPTNKVESYQTRRRASKMAVSTRRIS
jgi:hypothetical protein